MNKPEATKRFLSLWLWLSVVFTFTLLPAYADQIKTNNLSNLELGTSWISGVAPAGNDNAIWNAIVATASNCTNTFGSAVTWGGIVISNASRFYRMRIQ